MLNFLARTRLYAALAGASLAALSTAAAPAYAQQQTIAFNIPAQSMSTALVEYSRQSGAVVVAPASLVAGKAAPTVQGELTPDIALAQLLDGSGLRAQRREGGLTLVQDTTSPPTQLGAERPAAPSEQELVVTAQRREESLEDVPISISVLTGERLDASAAQGATEMLRGVPGVSAAEGTQGGGTLIAVRGVTAAGPLFFGSSPIGYYLDSMPFGLVKSAISPDVNVYDLQRIEVLRGPQGTLYGASALNGVVRVLTHPVDLDAFDFKARGSISGTEHGGENYRSDFAANMPIIPGVFGARAVLGYQDLSGWIDRPNNPDANDAEILNGRVKLAADVTDALTLGATAWISRANYGAPSQSANNRTNPFTQDESIETNFDLYGFSVDYDFGPLTLSSRTSHLEFYNYSGMDYAAFGLANTLLITGVEAETFSQEFLLSSAEGEHWRWSLGAIYRDGEDRMYQYRPQYVAPVDQRNYTESYAVYGEVTRLLMDGRLELTGGVRYFEDQVENIELSRLDGSAALINSSNSFDKVTPRAVITYHANDDMTLYASYAQGFRSGFGQNPSVLAVNPSFPPVDADTLTNYEVGVKGNLFQGRLRYDAAAYYIDWQDVQQSLTVLVGNVGVPTRLPALINGESASGYGFDFSIVAEPTDGLEFNLALGWNGLEMDSQVFSNNVLLFDVGDRLNFSPEWVGSAGVDYSFPLGSSGFEGHLSAGVTYTTEQSGRTIAGANRIIATSDDLLVGRASFAVEAPEHWTFTLFAENIGNEEGIVNNQPANVPNWALHLRPRTIGVQLEYSLY
jgi:outer membrane receptor protein involved in Fe transport